MSWYALFFKLPWPPERAAAWIVPRLRRRWDPSYDAAGGAVGEPVKSW